MATIHTGTTMAPEKLELLADWLPRQSWHRGTEEAAALTRAGGFRLDDPDGEVGIEFMLVGAGEETTYLVPMTYRGAPLDGLEDALIGTSQHGVLGTRWIYDGAHDQVAVTQLLEFMCGRCEAQSQTASETPDPSVGRQWMSEGRPTVSNPLAVSNGEQGRTTIAVEVDGAPGFLDLHRVPGTTAPGEAVLGSVEADWTRGDGTPARGTVVVLRPA